MFFSSYLTRETGVLFIQNLTRFFFAMITPNQVRNKQLPPLFKHRKTFKKNNDTFCRQTMPCSMAYDSDSTIAEEYILLLAPKQSSLRTNFKL